MRIGIYGIAEIGLLGGMLWFGYACWTAYGVGKRPPKVFAKSMFQAETLRVGGATQPLNRWEQPTAAYKTGTWSGAKHLFFPDGKVGNLIEFYVPTPKQDGKTLKVNLTTANDYAVVAIYVDKKQVGEVDLYSRFISNKIVEILRVDASKAQQDHLIVGFRITGMNKDAPFAKFNFGVDGFWYE